MPRPFNEFIISDLKRISRTLEDHISVLQCLNTRFDTVTDKNGGIAVMEYKKALKVEIPPDLNNPDFTINIDNNFKIWTNNFNNADDNYIKDTINRYLKINNFI